MTTSLYFLADHDGILHVCAMSSDWSEPRFITNYWPTKIKTRDFCAHFEVKPEELKARVEVSQSMIGQFYATSVADSHGMGKRWNGVYLDLVDGGRTKSVASGIVPAAAPKARKGTTYEWDMGGWTKRTASGKSERVTPVPAG